MPIPEGDEREKKTESLFKGVIDERFPYLGKELDIWVQKVNRTPNYLNTKKSFSKTHYNKLSKVNDAEVLKAARGKDSNLQKKPQHIIIRFLKKNKAGKSSMI